MPIRIVSYGGSVRERVSAVLAVIRNNYFAKICDALQIITVKAVTHLPL
jgi:ribosomal protein L37AE/L43A